MGTACEPASGYGLPRNHVAARGGRFATEAGLSHGRARHRYGHPELSGFLRRARNAARDVVRHGRRRSICRLPTPAGDEDCRCFRPGAVDAAPPVNEDARAHVAGRVAGTIDGAAAQCQKVCA